MISNAAQKEARVMSYLNRCQPAVSGKRGHDHTFRVVCAVVKGFNCSEHEALRYLSNWNSGCQPPWSDDELAHKVASAMSAPNMLGTPGYLLEKENDRSATAYNPTLKPSTPTVTLDVEAMMKRKIADAGKAKLATLPDWTIDQMISESPVKPPTTPDGSFDAFLGAWNSTDIIWVGHVKDSGYPSCSGYFAKPEVWLRRGIPGSNKNFTSGCTYKPGTYSRCKEDLVEHRYAIVESDKLTYERQGAILKYLISIGLPIRMIVDTCGASLHGWLDVSSLPADYIERLQILLCGLHDGLEPDPTSSDPNKQRRKFYGGMGCDPSTFRGSQPCRLPGAFREPNLAEGKRGGMQRIVYLSH